MKKCFFISLVIQILMLTSCASTMRSGYVILPEEKTSYNIEFNEIVVNVERVEEDVFADQLTHILQSMLCLNSKADSKTIFLDVQINQRSYYEDITQYNSIYTIYTLTDEYGNCLLKNGIYKKTTDSIASSVLQYKISSLIAQSVKSYVLRSANNKKEKKSSK